MAVGAAAVGATAKASIQLSERTVVAGNNAQLWGALAVGGDGTLETQLAGGANVTGNTLTEVGAGGGIKPLCSPSLCRAARQLLGSLWASPHPPPATIIPTTAPAPGPPSPQTGVVALGSKAIRVSSGETDSTNTVEGNSRTSRVAVIEQQPAVATTLKVLLGAGEQAETHSLCCCITTVYCVHPSPPTASQTCANCCAAPSGCLVAPAWYKFPRPHFLPPNLPFCFPCSLQGQPAGHAGRAAQAPGPALRCPGGCTCPQRYSHRARRPAAAGAPAAWPACTPDRFLTSLPARLRSLHTGARVASPSLQGPALTPPIALPIACRSCRAGCATARSPPPPPTWAPWPRPWSSCWAAGWAAWPASWTPYWTPTARFRCVEHSGGSAVGRSCV